MPRIWDIHVHFPRPRPGRAGQEPRDPAATAQRTPQEAVDHLAERLREVGTVKASILCNHRGRRSRAPATMDAFDLTHEQSIEIAMKHDDLFVAHAVVDPEVTTYDRIHKLHAVGYRGLKIIGTRREYDCRDYFPVYRAAEELDMPILFHCGVVGGFVDLLAHHPRRDPDSARRLREQDEAARKAAAGEAPEANGPRYRGGPRDTAALYMRPFHLESIANRFPRLKIIGAHMGGTGNYDEAASVARWRRWVYFDLSGGRTIERHSVERNLIGGEIPIEKLIFGSDCPADEIHEHTERFSAIFEKLGLSDEEKDLIWYRNAAEMFGVEQPVWAGE